MRTIFYPGKQSVLERYARLLKKHVSNLAQLIPGKPCVTGSPSILNGAPDCESASAVSTI